MLAGEIDARFGAFRLNSRIELAGGGVHAVFGPSGCGKSLLLRWLAGLVQPHGARLRYADEVWQDGGLGIPPHRRGLGYVAQQPTLFPHLSVRENLEYGHRRCAARRVDLDTVITALSLEGLFRQPVHSLSGGQRQRVAIGRALLCSPRLLLLDEPLSALDRPARLGILRDLRRIQAELDVPMLYVSHVAEEVERLADRVMLMRDGCLAPGRTVAELCGTSVLDPEAGAVNLLDVDPVAHDPVDSLVELACGEVRLLVPSAAPLAGRVRLRIAARDVGVSLHRPEQTGYLNMVAVEVVSIEAADAGRALLRCVAAGGVPLCAEVTTRSLGRLGVTVGGGVQLLVKSAALLG